MSIQRRALGVRLMWTVLFFAMTWIAALQPAYAQGSDTESLRFLPVQDAGRVKPFDTFARETLQLVYGSQEYRTAQGDKRPAIEIVLTWMLLPQYWDTQKIIQITHRGLKESLRLNIDEKLFTPAELFATERLGLVMGELASFRQSKEKLGPYFQAAQRLESQLGTYQAMRQGSVFRLVPPPASAAGETRWRAASDLDGVLKEKFALVLRSFIQTLPNGGPDFEKDKMGDVPPLSEAVASFISLARAENPGLYPSENIIALEVHDRTLHPFQLAWVIYLVAGIFLAVAWQTDRQLMYRLGWVAVGLAFILHTYGFGIRMYLTGRPPVSNMYESVVWVSWGALVFAMIFEAIYKRRFVLLSGAIVGVLCLVVADMAPTILDPSLHPLEPVLRSNMWLTVHVLTITLSYSAFFLSWCLGNIGLGFVLRGEKVTSDRLRMMVQSLYRSLQVGVVLLAAGTILGGVWADYSWGRFWGWDPKETWAFIALLGYLALLHGRLVGLVQNFGMMVGSIVAFNLVIMAWYGVNFVLGAGLHSYGFGAGGVQYVAAFVIADLLYVGYVAYVRWSQMKSGKASSSAA